MTLIARQPPDRRNLIRGPVLLNLAAALLRLEAQEVGDSTELSEVQALRCPTPADRKVRRVVGPVGPMSLPWRRTASFGL